MAKKAKPGDQVTNLTGAKEIIRNSVPKIVGLKLKRKELNAEIAAEREKVNAAGVSKNALDYAIKVKEMDPEDRAHFDEGYAIARDAIGIPQSKSLFDFIASSDDEQPEDGKPDDEEASDSEAEADAEDDEPEADEPKKPLSGTDALAAARAGQVSAPAPDALTH